MLLNHQVGRPFFLQNFIETIVHGLRGKFSQAGVRLHQFLFRVMR